MKKILLALLIISAFTLTGCNAITDGIVDSQIKATATENQHDLAMTKAGYKFVDIQPVGFWSITVTGWVKQEVVDEYIKGTLKGRIEVLNTTTAKTPQETSVIIDSSTISGLTVGKE